jgi:hypothetical protein
MEYTFTFKYRLSDDDCNHSELVERLGAAGCDDALIGVGQPGRIALEFTREADSAAAALLSALADVKRAIPTAKLIEAAPDFVGLTDFADVVGVTRQNMRKLMINNVTSFPAPVHEGAAAIWHLADVFAWVQAKGLYDVEQTLVEVANTTKQINLTKEVAQLDPRLQREVCRLIS